MDIDELVEKAADKAMKKGVAALTEDREELTPEEKKSRNIRYGLYGLGAVAGIAVVFKVVFAMFWYVVGAAVVGAGGLYGWTKLKPKLTAGREQKRLAEKAEAAEKARLDEVYEAEKRADEKKQNFEDEFAALQQRAERDDS